MQRRATGGAGRPRWICGSLQYRGLSFWAALKRVGDLGDPGGANMSGWPGG